MLLHKTKILQMNGALGFQDFEDLEDLIKEKNYNETLDDINSNNTV